MNKMNIPGFSAEAALGSRQRIYRLNSQYGSSGDRTILPMCPVCGSGETLYYDWECKDNKWQLVLVGRRGYGSCDARGTMIFGRTTDCYETDREVGGGGDQDCYEVSCSPPPSRFCGKRRPETHLPLGGTDSVIDVPF
jgi:hypothetical protein